MPFIKQIRVYILNMKNNELQKRSTVLAETPNPDSVPTGSLRQALQTVQNVMSNEALKKLHRQKDPMKGEHYRIRCDLRLTKPEKSSLSIRLAQMYGCSKVTVEDANWTKAWLKSAKGVAICLFF